MRNGTRASGTNPRAAGTNPRAAGTNRSAGTPRDAERVRRAIGRAMQRVTDGGRRWCDTCDDSGLVAATGGRWAPCPTHRTMTSREAAHVMAAPASPAELVGAYERLADERRRRPR